MFSHWIKLLIVLLQYVLPTNTTDKESHLFVSTFYKSSSSGTLKPTFNSFTCNQEQLSQTLNMKSPLLSFSLSPWFIRLTHSPLKLWVFCAWIVGLSNTPLLKCWGGKLWLSCFGHRHRQARDPVAQLVIPFILIWILLPASGVHPHVKSPQTGL